MTNRQDREQAGYGPVAKTFHWLVVALLLAQYFVGWVMPDIHRGTKAEGMILWHLWIGATIVVVLALRLILRIARPVPLLEDGTPPWQNKLAHATHWSLYLCLILLLGLGWANASARDYPVSLFGIVSLPPIMPVNSRIGMAAGDIHSFVGWCLLALIGLHVAAALYHWLILRDRVLQRMMSER